jgi:hypothetical protein
MKYTRRRDNDFNVYAYLVWLLAGRLACAAPRRDVLREVDAGVLQLRQRPEVADLEAQTLES